MKTFEEYVKNLNEGIFDNIKGAVKGAVQGYKDASKKQPINNVVPQEVKPENNPSQTKPENANQKVFYAGTPAQDLGIAIKEIFAPLKQKDPESASKIFGLIKNYCENQNEDSVLNLYSGVFNLKNAMEGTSLFDEIRSISHSVSDTIWSEIMKIAQHHGFKFYRPTERSSDNMDWVTVVKGDPVRTKFVDTIIVPGLFNSMKKIVFRAIVKMK